MTMQPDQIDDQALVLGIETSCDETAAAVVRADGDHGGTILANKVLSQIDEHRPYGGVVPEIAARSHLDHLDHLIEAAMQESGVGFDDLDGVAATGGPGLIGGVMVGVMAGKTIALAANKPFIAVNHLEAHALTVRLGADVEFPYLLLLISGGHCQLLIVEGVGQYRRLGTTIDDALGEAFDKTAKLLGLGYPGGPLLEKAAKAGHAGAIQLPRPMKGRAGCDFSFSGLKTAVRQALEKIGADNPDEQTVADIALAFHEAAADVLADRCGHAIEMFRDTYPAGDTLVVAGGVAANSYLREALDRSVARHDMSLVAAPPALCTDNAAMVAWAGVERLRLGLTDPLDFKPRPRWPLDPDGPKVGFAGVKA